ncbi:hypothetical protein ACFQY5_08740 [Paeniroseomonas aquatica]|uniref:hypothetical protein n=1 Tax=Paeniroseomonas aquatica TaxID=373043 RepID=UPI0036170F03
MGAAAQPAPPAGRIYPLQGGVALLPVAGGADYQVQDEAGRVIRPWGPPGPDGRLRLPPAAGTG